MSNGKRWHEISEDELMHREMLKHEWKIKPTRKTVALLESRITEVLTKLGVDCEKDSESIRTQMDILGIFINSLSEEQAPKAAGIYVSATIGGVLQPYAYISAAKMTNGKAKFPITYWGSEKLDEGGGVRIVQ